MPVPMVVVIGASAGGVEALTALLAALPADTPAAIVVVLHMAPAAPSVLPSILARAGRLPVTVATDGALLRAGQVYVGPPDAHLVINGDALALVRGPREHGHCPAIDPLFSSAARAHGRHVIGVVLSGNLSDGTLGLAEIKRHGGVALVQEPGEALFGGMPRSAIGGVAVDAVLPLAALAARIDLLAHAAADAPAA